jgi:hypothetical protein
MKIAISPKNPAVRIIALERVAVMLFILVCPLFGGVAS